MLLKISHEVKANSISSGPHTYYTICSIMNSLSVLCNELIDDELFPSEKLSIQFLASLFVDSTSFIQSNWDSKCFFYFPGIHVS